MPPPAETCRRLSNARESQGWATGWICGCGATKLDIHVLLWSRACSREVAGRSSGWITGLSGRAKAANDRFPRPARSGSPEPANCRSPPGSEVTAWAFGLRQNRQIAGLPVLRGRSPVRRSPRWPWNQVGISGRSVSYVGLISMLCRFGRGSRTLCLAGWPGSGPRNAKSPPSMAASRASRRLGMGTTRRSWPFRGVFCP